jgi:hypothetical protein
MAENQFADFSIELGEEFQNADAWGGEQRPLVPPGDYKLTVVAISQEDGNAAPYIAVTFEVTEGESTGSRVYNNYSLSPKAIGRLKSLMIASGMGLERFVASELMGATIMGTVVHTEGAAKVDAQGNAQPPRTFANLINERAVEVVKAETKAPPITKATTTKPANGTTTRRA